MSVRDLIRDKLTAKRLSMKEASEAIGRNHAYLQQYLERGVPATLHEDDREALAPLLGVKPGDLRERLEDAVKDAIKALPKNSVNDNTPRAQARDAGATRHSP